MRTYPAALMLLLILLPGAALRADFIYFPWEYNAIYNEKVALEFELNSLHRQLRNDREKLDAEIKQLNNQIQSLKDQLAALEKNRKAEREECEKRIASLKKRIAILKSKSTARERMLVENARDTETAYKKRIDELRGQLEDQEQASIKKIEELNRICLAQKEKLGNRVASLEEELSRQKQLNESQKRELNRLADQARAIEEKLQKEIKDGSIRLKRYHNRIVINIDDRISFDSGSAKLKKGIFPALRKITEILMKYPENRVMIEGHTDNVPISTARFPSNWELSTARALSVLRQILKNEKLDPRKFAAVGYGEYRPDVPNDTPENRALNRRVDIVVIPRAQAAAEGSGN